MVESYLQNVHLEQQNNLHFWVVTLWSITFL